MASESGYSWHGDEEGLQQLAAAVMVVSERGGGAQTPWSRRDGEGIEDQGDLPSTVVAMMVLLLQLVVVEEPTAIAGGKRQGSWRWLTDQNRWWLVVVMVGG